MGLIPAEIKSAVSALDNDDRWRILESLLTNEELSYTQILDILEIRKGSLTNHLKNLIFGNILENYSRQSIGERYDSFYKVTRFGKDLIDGLVGSLPDVAEANIRPIRATADFVLTHSELEEKLLPDYVRYRSRNEKEPIPLTA